MRIIAGACKGRTLKTPKWDGLRPTSDRLRETLFNILAHRIDDVRVLDVFAGTGAIGLEALSRGAKTAVFIEKDRRAAALIAENAALCGVQDRCAIIREAAEYALDTLAGDGPFDVIVFDPPYDLPAVEQLLSKAAPLLARDGILVLEHAWRRSPPGTTTTILRRTVRSGDSALSFYDPAPAMFGSGADDE
jgi:16S rRNA (guanine(966)-N(2))-methyltransferase RsmD